MSRRICASADLSQVCIDTDDLYSSLQYLYLDSEVWNSIKTLLWRKFSQT